MVKVNSSFVVSPFTVLLILSSVGASVILYGLSFAVSPVFSKVKVYGLSSVPAPAKAVEPVPAPVTG